MSRPSTSHLQVPMANTAVPRSPVAADPQGPQHHFPMSFYDLPAQAAAIFSTKMGQCEKRSLPKPPPSTVVRSNLDADVAEKAAALEGAFPPHLVRSIKEPRGWKDLYEYFDGHGLYVDGVVFCWHVIGQIARRNVFLETRFLKEIDDYAAEWIIFHKEWVIQCQDPTDLTALFNPEEAEGLDALPSHYIDLLRQKLQFHRATLMKQQQQQEREAFEMRLQQRPFKPLYAVAEGPYSPMPQPFPAIQPRGGSRTVPHPLSRKLNFPPDLRQYSDGIKSNRLPLTRIHRPIIHLWRVKTGGLLATLHNGHSGPVGYRMLLAMVQVSHLNFPQLLRHFQLLTIYSVSAAR
jgi:hypothetical protein